jgi:23S rRNA pseudouridine1911/1915/1917 synthase
MMKKLSLKATEAHRGMRLDHVLAEWLPTALGRPVSRALARKLIVAGAVYLNGKRVRIASKELLAGAKVEAWIDEAKLESGGPARDRAFTLGPERVLFEDEWLIVVDKPPGLPTQPTLDEARDNLFAAVKRFLAARAPHPYVALHHRLDRDTSGVIALAKHVDANAGLARAFAGREARKTYVALTGPGREPPREVRDFLGKLPGAGKRARFGAVRSGGDPAHTEFSVLERLARGFYLEARPLTGRTHQIRVHLAGVGLPILGDELYGGAGGAPRLMLHARRLELPHPVTGEMLAVESAVPGDFSEMLARLRG